jgi:hypothetical protein
LLLVSWRNELIQVDNWLDVGAGHVAYLPKDQLQKNVKVSSKNNIGPVKSKVTLPLNRLSDFGLAQSLAVDFNQCYQNIAQ